MISRFVLAGAALVAVVGATWTAHAQEMQPNAPPPTYERRSFLEQRVEAPTNALELGVGTGYTQGFGSLQSGVGFPSVAEAGLGVEVDVGYRIVPRLSVGISGQYQEFNAQRATGARGVSGGVNATYHLDPYTRFDPFVSLGAGYRLLWETFPEPAPTLLTHGFELAKLQVGFDLKATPEIAIGPVVGAGLDLFLWQVPSGGTTVAIDDPRLSTFVFAGVQGRFDVGGGRERPPGVVPVMATRR